MLMLLILNAQSLLFIQRWLNQVTHEFRDQTLFSVDDMVSRK